MRRSFFHLFIIARGLHSFQYAILKQLQTGYLSFMNEFTVLGTIRETVFLMRSNKSTLLGTLLLSELVALSLIVLPAMLFSSYNISDPFAVKTIFGGEQQVDNLLFVLFKLHPTTTFLRIIGILIMLPGAIAAVNKIAIEHARSHVISMTVGFRALWFRLIPVLFTLILAGIIVLPPIIWSSWFERYPTALELILCWGYFLLVYPFIIFSIPLAADKINNPFMAVYQSIILTGKNFWKVMSLITISQYLAFALIPGLMIIGVQIYFYNDYPASILNFFFVMGTALGILVYVIPLQLFMVGAMYHKLVDQKSNP